MTDYYIRTSGDDVNDGLTPGAAWASFTKAFDTIGAGDTVYIGPGLYEHSEAARAAFGGTSGNPKVFQGDPYGTETGDDPGIVAMISRLHDFAGTRYDNLIEWTGDTKFFEFHDMVFLGAAQQNTDDMITLGDSVGAFGMDGIVFEDCMFFNKGATGRYDGDLIIVRYGDGDTPVGNGIRFTRCNFDGRVRVTCDDNAVATFDIDFIMDSCVFSGGGYITFAPSAGVHSISGIKIRNCSNVANSVNYLYGVVTMSNVHGTNSVELYGIVNEANGPAVTIDGATDSDSAVANYTTAIQHDSLTVDQHAAVGNGVIGIGVMNPRNAFWGYEANYVYDKFYGMKPYMEFEPVEIFGMRNPAIGGADPDEVPSLDYYGRSFQANHANSRVAVGFYNGDFAVAPFNDVLYTWQDPDTAWANEDLINEVVSGYTSCSVAGSISTNYLRIEKPSVRIDTNQIIHRVFVRPYASLVNDSPDLNFNFYTLDEGEDLGGFSYPYDDSTSGHWFGMQEVPAPSGGWTKTHVENLECRIWMTTGTLLRVSCLAIYLETGQADAGAVSAQGPRNVETTVVNTGANALKFTQAGTYQTTIPVKASVEVTISVYARKDSNYTGTGPKIEVFNIPGGIAEQTDTHVGAADAWEEISVTFTPTLNGPATVRLLSQCTSLDGIAYFDNLTRS